MLLLKSVTPNSKVAKSKNPVKLMDTQFEGIDPTTVENVTCIGAGPIGAGWAAYFLSRGYKVTSYIHDPSEETSLKQLISDAWVSLEAMGLENGASLDNHRCSTDLATALSGAQFVIRNPNAATTCSCGSSFPV